MQVEELKYIKTSLMDNKPYLVLKDKAEKIRLVEGEGYGNYKLHEGMILYALVRGRGCAGQEVTELLHPVYKTGEVYPFSFVRANCIEINDEKVTLVVVVDNDNIEYFIRSDKEINYSFADNVWVQLQSQKKGRLTFTLAEINIS